jgi:hypothetical protein
MNVELKRTQDPAQLDNIKPIGRDYRVALIAEPRERNIDNAELPEDLLSKTRMTRILRSFQEKGLINFL